MQQHRVETHVLTDKSLELVGRNLSQTFESCNLGFGFVLRQFLDGFDSFFVAVAIERPLFVAHTEEGRLQDVDVACAYQFGAEAQEEGEQQQADVHAVDIGIGGDDDVVVAQVFHAVVNVQGAVE